MIVLSKAVKLKNDNYLDSTSIVHKKKKLSTILEEVTIVETVENEKGTAIKFSDGTMICTLYDVANITISKAYGNLYQDDSYTWTYPVPFVSNPVVNLGMFQFGETSASWGACYSNNNTIARFRVYDIVERNAGYAYIKATAIGRWK